MCTKDSVEEEIIKNCWEIFTILIKIKLSSTFLVDVRYQTTGNQVRDLVLFRWVLVERQFLETPPLLGLSGDNYIILSVIL